MRKPPLGRSDILYPELSYRIIGALFSVWNEFGDGYKERHYQKATAISLGKANLSFQEQVPVKILYQHQDVGVYFLDFLVENKVVLEIKRKEYFAKQNIEQVHNYLKAADLQLGIIANFTSKGMQHKRIVTFANSYIRTNW